MAWQDYLLAFVCVCLVCAIILAILEEYFYVFSILIFVIVLLGAQVCTNSEEEQPVSNAPRGGVRRHDKDYLKVSGCLFLWRDSATPPKAG
jgi:hypothetical protein